MDFPSAKKASDYITERLPGNVVDLCLSLATNPRSVPWRSPFQAYLGEVYKTVFPTNSWTIRPATKVKTCLVDKCSVAVASWPLRIDIPLLHYYYHLSFCACHSLGECDSPFPGTTELGDVHKIITEMIKWVGRPFRQWESWRIGRSSHLEENELTRDTAEVNQIMYSLERGDFSLSVSAQIPNDATV